MKLWAYALVAFLFATPAFACEEPHVSVDQVFEMAKQVGAKVVANIQGKDATDMDTELRGGQEGQADDIVVFKDSDGDLFAFGFKDACSVAQGYVPEEIVAKYTRNKI